MKVVTKSQRSSAESEMSTGSGVLAGSPMSADRLRRERAVGLVRDEPELRGEGRAGEGVIVARLERPADLEGRARHLEGLDGLAGVEVPDDHRVAEVLHGVGVGEQLAEVHHVVGVAGEGRREHPVEPRLHPDVVAVLRTLGQPYGLDVLAVVVVLDEIVFVSFVVMIPPAPRWPPPVAPARRR